MTTAIDRYLQEFSRLAPQLPGASLPWLMRSRHTAAERLASLGFPDRRQEDWKYTDVGAIERAGFSAAPAAVNGAVDAELMAALALPGAHLLVFVDGRHVRSLSKPGALPAGVTLTSLAELIERDPERLEEIWDDDWPDGFAALNGAFASDGACLELRDGVALEAPVQLLFVATADNFAVCPRNLIIAGAGSSVIVIEHHVAAGAPRYLTNAATRIVAGRGARVAHHKLQQESGRGFHIARVSAVLGPTAHLASGSFALGAGLSRVGIDVGLAAEGAACDLDGLYLAGGRQHVDHHTRIDHLKPLGTSREFYKGIIAGAARAVFNGKVIVHADAQGSDAFQSNRNLLLSANAEVDSKPQLEINADDVKCGHGATVGQLDPDQVFYLRSRGIAEAPARALLTEAFAKEAIDRVAETGFRQRLATLVHEQLPILMREVPS